MLESLEYRRLLSAVLEDGVLNVGGTNRDPDILDGHRGHDTAQRDDLDELQEATGVGVRA